MMKPTLLLFCLTIQTCHANPPLTEANAIRAIVGEASNQGLAGMTAVACAIRNRGTLDGVMGYSARHVASEPVWVWKMAARAWQASAKRDVVRGASAWESTDFPRPEWAKDMVETVRIGKHRFYRKK